MWPNRAWPIQEHKKLQKENTKESHTQAMAYNDNTNGREGIPIGTLTDRTSKKEYINARQPTWPMEQQWQTIHQEETINGDKASSQPLWWHSIHQSENHDGKASARENHSNTASKCGKTSERGRGHHTYKHERGAQSNIGSKASARAQAPG